MHIFFFQHFYFRYFGFLLRLKAYLHKKEQKIFITKLTAFLSDTLDSDRIKSAYQSKTEDNHDQTKKIQLSTYYIITHNNVIDQCFKLSIYKCVAKSGNISIR